MRQPQLWQEEDLLELIQSKREENIELDYKRADALQLTDGKKNEISKDISAFANSIGGTILYGMEEDAAEPHYPTALTPIDAAPCSKEWIEQVINSRIQPRLDGVLINSIELKQTSPGRFAYAVLIPEGTTAYQASDKRYYKRFNFQSVAMEDYEIRQTMNRASRPDYKVELLLRPIGQTPDRRQTSQFEVTLENRSDIVGHEVSVVLFVPAGRLREPDGSNVEYQGIPYARITGIFIPGNAFLGAIPAAHPLASYQLSFRKDIFMSYEFPFTVIVKVFDQFGLALTSYFRTGFPGFTLEREVRTSKRISTVNKLE
jgi:hypothetical protein